MRLKIFITALVCLITVKISSAQISIPNPAVITTGNPFTLYFDGELPTGYVVSAYVNPSIIYSSSVTGVYFNLYSGNGNPATPSTLVGALTMAPGYTGGGISIPIDIGIYDSTTDRMSYSTVWGVVLAYP